MDTVRHLEHRHPDPLPPGIDQEMRTPPALVADLLRTYTDAGETVLDPFAGFGTTLRVAERMDRDAVGVEYERDRVEYIRERGDHGRVHHGDAIALGSLALPAVDCCVTSPPFMISQMDEDPLQNDAGESDYRTYLHEMQAVFGQIRALLRPGGHAVLDVSNLRHDGTVTTLAWDLARAVREELHFDGETVVVWTDSEDDGWDGAFGYGYDHSYCLAFSKQA